ncbi:Autophagy protein 5, partial [Dissostichus eleginoides]
FTIPEKSVCYSESTVSAGGQCSLESFLAEFSSPVFEAVTFSARHSGGLCRWHGCRARRGFSAPSPPSPQ